MTATTITTNQRLQIVKHLAAGKDLDFTAAATRLPRSEVLDIASHHGYPDTDRLQRAVVLLQEKADREADDTALTQGSAIPETRNPVNSSSAPRVTVPPSSTAGTPPPLTQPDEIRVLINTGKSHPSKRIQALANKVLDDADKLRAAITEDRERNAEKRRLLAEREAARAEVKRLEEQLAAAKAKLRGTPVKKTPAAATTAPPAAPETGPRPREIRAWAAEMRIDCPARGIVPAVIREAYAQAHLQEAS